MRIKKKILVVEDESPIREALKNIVKNAGFTAKGARNGAEGLKVALEWHPDLVLLDIVMPRMDGMEMLKELRRNARGENMPVMILTNLVDQAKKDEARMLGVDDFWVKTEWDFTALIRNIESKLRS